MIHVQRIEKKLDFVDTPNNFKEKLKKEFEDAKNYFTVSKIGKFEFDCYRNVNIKEKLRSEFKEKCAYCDSTITHISAGDIEHFRPKSKYWWLAAEWNNLLFACEKCNRTGKNDAFPLLNSIIECSFNDPIGFQKEEQEYRLLINPCIENPEKYFEYDEREAVIRPLVTLGTNSKEKQMAEISIDTFKLCRKELTEEREKILILLLVQIEYTKKAIDEYQDLINFPKKIRDEFEKK